MLNEGTRDVRIATTLDNRGSDCASGFAKLLEIVDSMAPGEVLEVLSTDHAAPRELRDWAGRSGNTILEISSSGLLWRRQFRILVRKEQTT